MLKRCLQLTLCVLSICTSLQARAENAQSFLQHLQQNTSPHVVVHQGYGDGTYRDPATLKQHLKVAIGELPPGSLHVFNFQDRGLSAVFLELIAEGFFKGHAQFAAYGDSIAFASARAHDVDLSGLDWEVPIIIPDDHLSFASQVIMAAAQRPADSTTLRLWEGDAQAFTQVAELVAYSRYVTKRHPIQVIAGLNYLPQITTHFDGRLAATELSRLQALIKQMAHKLTLTFEYHDEVTPYESLYTDVTGKLPKEVEATSRRVRTLQQAHTQGHAGGINDTAVSAKNKNFILYAQVEDHKLTLFLRMTQDKLVYWQDQQLFLHLNVAGRPISVQRDHVRYEKSPHLPHEGLVVEVDLEEAGISTLGMSSLRIQLNVAPGFQARHTQEEIVVETEVWDQNSAQMLFDQERATETFHDAHARVLAYLLANLEAIETPIKPGIGPVQAIDSTDSPREIYQRQLYVLQAHITSLQCARIFKS